MFDKLEDLAKNNKKISYFHIRSGSPLAYRQTGEIHKIQDVIVKAQDLQDLISTNCNEVEMKKFNESLTSDHFAKIQTIINTMPRLQHELEIENPKTKVKSKVVLSGLQSFFVSPSHMTT